MSTKIRRVNLAAGPGAGKSTIAAWLFAAMKIICNEQNIDLKIEHVQERLKAEVWAGRKNFDRWDQWDIALRQFNKEYTLLKSGVDIIITDSPLVIYPYYAKRSNTPCINELANLVEVFERDYPSLTIFVERGDKTYRSHGRNETLEEAKIADNGIKQYLMESGTNFVVLPFDQRRSILARILSTYGLDPNLATAYN